VNRWVGHIALHRLDGLNNRAGRGRKPWLPRAAVQPVVEQAVNLVERFFRDLTEFITEKSFASTRELADAIIAFLVARNDNPRLRLERHRRRHPAQDRCCQTGARRHSGQ
jgi:hypothetical protein